MVLFPDEHARPLQVASGEETGEGSADAAVKRVLLVVIDGTWKEAKKIARRNREHWEKAARDWEARGAGLHYICLDSEEGAADAATAPPKRSIYGDLRR